MNSFPSFNNAVNQTLSSNAGDNGTSLETCLGIDPNPDIMGIGVRAAFYIQSGLNALLVTFSPTDSVATTWSSTLLTTALIVAAFVLKAKGSLTLYHATLVLNFATLSCISSLAAAPTLPIWRLTPQEYYAREFARRALTLPDNSQDQNFIINLFETSVRKKELRAAQKRGRIVLALAILIQVALQWAWGIFLFVAPDGYSQPECNGNTTLNFIVKSYNVEDINTYQPFSNGTGSVEHARHYEQYFIWALWIFVNLMITMFLTILLAVSSPNRAIPEVPSTTVPGSHATASSATPIIEALYHLAARSVWSVKLSLKEQLLFVLDCFVIVLWALFIYASEKQRQSNNVAAGENDFGGFGQVTALLVSLAPLWGLSVALYKYPALRRRLRRLEERHHGLQQNPNVSAEDIRPSGHIPMPSEEVYPMQDLPRRRMDPGTPPRPILLHASPSERNYSMFDPDSPEVDRPLLGSQMPLWGTPLSAHVSSRDDTHDLGLPVSNLNPDMAEPLSPGIPSMQRRNTHWYNASP